LLDYRLDPQGGYDVPFQFHKGPFVDAPMIFKYNPYDYRVGDSSKTLARGAKVRIARCVYSVLLVLICASAPCLAADPPIWFNPLKSFVRSPFSSELEIYTGGITGRSVGAAFDSATKGDLGIRYTFGFMRAFNFSVNYMYSNQTRSFTAVTPPVGTLPTGTALMRAANLNMFFGNGEMSLARFGRNTFYLSPGIGFVRNGGRSMTIMTPLGTATSPILPGTAVTFNLGAGVKLFPLKHFGFRIDARDFVSGGGTGNLNASTGCAAIFPPPPACYLSSVQQYFGLIPVQNNMVFTVGLIFKIL